MLQLVLRVYKYRKTCIAEKIEMLLVALIHKATGLAEIIASVRPGKKLKSEQSYRRTYIY